MQQPVITISRQRGSGADDIAAMVAQKLGIPLYDQQVITRAAAAAGVSEAVMESAARRQSFISRMLDAMSQVALHGLEAPGPSFGGDPMLRTSADYRALIEQVLRNLADSGPGVIVGHGGGQAALRGRPDVLHVFMHAPFEQRAQRMMSYGNLSRAEAEKDVRETDEERTRYFQEYYKVNWYDLRLYDLVINTGGRSYADVTDEICAVAAKLPSRGPGEVTDARPHR